MLNINLHHISYCFNIALPLCIHTNLVYVNINIDILSFLNVVSFQNLVIAPGASIRINAVFQMTCITRSALALINSHWKKHETK